MLRAAQIAGVTRGTILKWRKGEARLPLDETALLAAAAGRSVDWVASGYEFQPHEDTAEVIWLPVVGSAASDDPPVPVPRAAVARRIPDMTRAAVVKVEGREMEPYIQMGDIVVIDREDRDLSDASGRVYVLRRGSRLVLSRALVQATGAVLLSNEVPKSRPEQVSVTVVPSLDVVGRVILALSEP